jgi:6-phosphogluconolactonase
MTHTRVASTTEGLVLAAAQEFVRVSTNAVQLRGRCTIALAGGSTPRNVYSALAHTGPLRSQVPWSRIEFFWGDERHVPPNDPQSNYRMAHETLLSTVPVASEQIHRIQAEQADAAVAAQMYENDIRSTLPAGDGLPRFDLILLGLGSDGHTASLFPGTAALSERERLCVDNWVASLNAHRITMTLPLLNAARVVMFIVSGADKASIVRQVLRRDHAGPVFPAQLVQPDGDVLWMLDRESASALGEVRL